MCVVYWLSLGVLEGGVSSELHGGQVQLEQTRAYVIYRVTIDIVYLYCIFIKYKYTT